MGEWVEGDVIANGIRIHYTRAGAPRGPVLVLLHGYSDNGRCWTPVARALETDYDIVMIDARGHGRSEAPEGPYSADVMADDVKGLCDALELEMPVLIGHSMGAITAMAAAGKYTDRFRAAILEDPVLRTAEEEEAMRREFEERQARGETQRQGPGLLEMRTLSHDEILAICRKQSPNWPEAELDPWATSKQQISLNLLNAHFERGEPWQEILPRIVVPVMILVPDVALGGMTTPAGAALAGTLLQHGEIVQVPGAGHNVRREQPEVFLQAVREYLKRHA
ncbi:MAG: alpha/beta fold hydrolase [Anaerolineae bacterium]